MWQNLTQKHQSSLLLGESFRPLLSPTTPASLHEWGGMMKLPFEGTNLHIPNKAVFPGF